MSSDKPTLLVTGALGRTGRILCERFQKEGYFVIATDRIEGICPCQFFVRTDICDLLRENSPERFRTFVTRFLGGRRIDLVIHNATLDEARSLPEVTMESLEAAYRCNVFAPVLLTRILAADLIQNQGAVIFTTSAYREAHLAGRLEYVSSKLALEGVVRSLGREYRNQLRVYGVGAARAALTDKNDDPELYARRIADACLRVLQEPEFCSSGDLIHL